MIVNASVEVNIPFPEIMKRVQNPKLWEFTANEWWKLLTPYTPMETGTMNKSVEIRPKEIEYTSPYAHYLYYGELMVDPNTGSSWAKEGVKKIYAGVPLNYSKAKNTLASKEWDKAAEPTQKPKLIKAVQNAIDKGRF